MILTYGYFVKDADNVVYDIINRTTPSAVQIQRKSDWESAEGQSVIEKEFDVVSRTDIDACYFSTKYTEKSESDIIIDEALYISDKKVKLVNDLAKYRWSITYDTVDGLYPISYMNGFPIFHTSEARERLIFTSTTVQKKLDNGSLIPTDIKKFKAVDGTWTTVEVGAVADWPEMLTETEQTFFEKEEDVEIAINALTTKAGVDAYNVETELDTLVKPILAADLTTYAYPIKYQNEDA